MNTTEVWKPIKGYEMFYEVSNQGRVRSIANRKCVKGIDTYSIRKTPLILNPMHNQFGHLHVHLVKGKKRKTKMVHRLVAEAFLNIPSDDYVVHHKDYNPKNNNVDNLEWCTQKENVNHSTVNMKHPKKYKTNTGEHHITYRKSNGLYRVCYKNTEKSFKNLADAIKYRDSIYEEYFTNK